MTAAAYGAGRAGASWLDCGRISLSAHTAQSGERLRVDRAIYEQPYRLMTAGLFPPQVIYRLLKIRRWPAKIWRPARTALHTATPWCGSWRHVDLQMLVRETHRRWAAAAAELGHIDRWLSVVLPVSSLHCGIAAEAFVIS